MSTGNLCRDWSTITNEELRENNKLLRKQEHRSVTIPSRVRYGTTPLYEIAALIHVFEMVPPFPPECLIVEIGSLVGKTTVALASMGVHRVVSIDPHDGPWEFDSNIKRDRRFEWGNTLSEFKANLERFDVADNVTIIQKYSDEAVKEWDEPNKICFIFIDGNHDYEWVLHDYHEFKKHFISGCIVAFHDYNPNSFPGVIKAVDEIEATGEVEHIFQLGSLKVFSFK